MDIERVNRFSIDNQPKNGMEWSLRGANAIISLRCTLKSGRADDYWEERAA